MIEKYELLYKDILIGKLSIDKNGALSYKALNANENDTILFFLKKDISCNIKDFPFFESRINNMKKFDLDTLNYQTDNYTIRKTL